MWLNAEYVSLQREQERGREKERDAHVHTDMLAHRSVHARVQRGCLLMTVGWAGRRVGVQVERATITGVGMQPRA